jgi:Trk K+ transport system NAD-binding subunit
VNSVFFIALRRLRAPLILIILIYAIATLGLTLIPGQDADGRPWHLTIFQAFYFVTYTATTIGFGEIPNPFTDVQRLWVTFIVYLSVIGWAYLLGSLLALAQDAGFRQSIVTARFRRGVRQLREPFYIVCGLGETGLMVIRALDALGFRFVVVDTEAARLHELELQELSADTLGLAADARVPEHLVMAGLLKPDCRGLLALANDDQVNMTIILAAHLLNPTMRTIARSHTPAVTQMLTSLGTCEVIDPFEDFSERLLLAIRAPDSHRLLTWLTGAPGTYLRPRIPAPPGAWIVCGYGRFGSQLVAAIERSGFQVAIVDPAGADRPGARSVKGLGTDRQALAEAGIADAAGLVAGTDSDTANLAIAIVARQLRPDLFIIGRQNLVANQPLFEALKPDMTMVSSQIIADECVASLRTQLLAEFLRIVRSRDDAWAHTVVERLRALTGDLTPEFWSFTVSAAATPGLMHVVGRSVTITLADIQRRTSERMRRADSLALLLLRSGRLIDLPPESLAIEPGDRILFAGTAIAEREQRDVMRNVNIAEHVLSGEDTLGGTIWRWTAQRRRQKLAARSAR